MRFRRMRSVFYAVSAGLRDNGESYTVEYNGESYTYRMKDRINRNMTEKICDDLGNE